MESLIAIYEGKELGKVTYQEDKIGFEYTEAWQNSPASFALSMSIPRSKKVHEDKAVRPFIEGLLPDNAQVLDAWGKRFHVSPRNPFRMLSHVGEECAGAVQFFRENRIDEIGNLNKKISVDWLSDDALAERIKDLVRDQSLSRYVSDQGHFSLAGAQAKTGLYYDETKQRWGVPYGETPTTHILKPSSGHYKEYDINEHFCLKLAGALGWNVGDSKLATIGDVPTIILKRYDRIQLQEGVKRIHQEDMCQALGYSSLLKYQSDGGPSAKIIFDAIRSFSSEPAKDTERFLQAIIYNWLVGGTDAHAKNYSFLITDYEQVRMAPLYDISSCLAYPREIPIQKARMAMKVSKQYKMLKILREDWKKAAKPWGFSEKYVENEMEEIAVQLRSVLPTVAEDIEADLNRSGLKSVILAKLVDAIEKRTEL